ncbi:energy transducer TonB [Mucilaginibacter pedocola]|nr:energy transducer TonB [Mucilaginibacter pedocola]
MKSTLLFLFFVLSVTFASAQKKDTSAYYMLNNGQVAENAETADFIRILHPADSELNGKVLTAVNDVFKDGTRRLTAYTYLNTPLAENGFEGPYIEYFRNGKRKHFRTYANGKITGQSMSYYPNGKLYSITEYKSDGTIALLQCNDSTGNVLTENGNGKWIKYSGMFARSVTGSVANGKEEGEWVGSAGDSVSYKNNYQHGVFISGDAHYKSGKNIHYTQLDTVPGFVGGQKEVGRYLGKGLRYPAIARENNIQGTVVISCVIEYDGAVSDVKLISGIGGGCDQEAIRVVQNSPQWNPGIENGIPIRMQFSLPISFALAD